MRRPRHAHFTIRAVIPLFAAVLCVTFGFVSMVGAQTPSGDGDDRVTGQTYVRHDGGTDIGIQHCNNAQTKDDGEEPATSDIDADTTDGGNRRQGNEPFSVIDPTNPDVVVAGWNDYCLTDLGAGWQGFGYSKDGGETWTNSLVPGYPQDTSAEGQRSPLYGDHTDAGDPIGAFDNEGNLYVGGIAFNRAGKTNGDVFVATYLADPGPAGYPVDYAWTRIVGRGTPSRNFQGIFQDKPMLEVDRTGGPHDGNLYVCWSRFTGFGQNRLFFSRSTDRGRTFSKPLSITNPGLASVQGCDIAIEGDGDVYVTFRTFADTSAKRRDGVAFVRSTNGGVSFSDARLIRSFIAYSPADPTRDCGDGDFECPSGFVFHRVPLEPRSTADQMSADDGVFLTYNAVRPSSIVPSETSYSSAGSGLVGQSLVYVVASWNDGRTWSAPVPVDPAARGHQFFPDIDALDGTVALVWQDNRTDEDYGVQYPIGNTLDEEGNAVSSGGWAQEPNDNIVNSWLASSSTSSLSFGNSVRASTQGHQSAYEMFSNRDIPFHGDYNWISLALDGGNLIGYATWTDNRNVVPGVDPRELEGDPFVDGFDVKQCRDDLADSTEGLLSPQMPLARRDAPFGGDTCPNGGGLDQDIYGVSFTT
jgi:hypothetical protein